MRYNTSLTTLTAAVGLLIASTASAQTLINSYPTSIIADALSVEGNNIANAPSKTIDGSGLSTLTGFGTHTSGTQLSWQSADNGNTAYESNAGWNPDTFDEYIQWDLGQVYTLDSIHVWNYNDSSRYDSGIKQLDIWVSAQANPGDPEAGGAGDWTLLGEDVVLSKAPGANGYAGVDLVTDTAISALPVYIRWVRFEIDSSHWDGGGFGNSGSLLGENQVALGEVQFFGAVPEPSAFALLAGMFGLTWVMLRRRA